MHLPTRRPLTANQRHHWSVKAGLTRQLRSEAWLLAKEQRIPPCERIEVQLIRVVTDRRRRDPSNLMPTQKACVDGLVDAKVVPDDTPEYVRELMPEIVVGSAAGLVLGVRRLA